MAILCPPVQLIVRYDCATAQRRQPWLVLPNPSLQPTCYGWLRQPTQAAELKR